MLKELNDTCINFIFFFYYYFIPFLFVHSTMFLQWFIQLSCIVYSKEIWFCTDFPIKIKFSLIFFLSNLWKHSLFFTFSLNFVVICNEYFDKRIFFYLSERKIKILDKNYFRCESFNFTLKSKISWLVFLKIQ